MSTQVRDALISAIQSVDRANAPSVSLVVQLAILPKFISDWAV
jgi:hypothetical protein